MELITLAAFNNYPLPARKKLLQVRADLFSVAAEYEVGDIKETLKWGEPSYLAAKGSAVRMAWKSKNPESYGIYFNCRTSS